MTAATDSRSPRQACPTGPATDRNATAVPAAIAAPAATKSPATKSPATKSPAIPLPNLENVLRLVQILLTYGRHLADTLDRRSAAPGFHLIARHFGTDRPAIILAHIRRGILRAAALQHVLLRRAARGRDLTRPPPPRPRLKPQTAMDADPAAAASSAAPQPARKRRRPAWRDDWLDNVENPLDPRHQPLFQDLLKEVRRHPIGRTLGKIYADLGIAPALSLATFWNDLFLVMLHYNGSPGEYDVRRWRREQHFQDQQERCPTLDLTWPEADVRGGRTDMLRVLGFLIGEPPVEPPLILPPEPPPWARPWSTAPAAADEQAAPPKATGPP
jgi:hypothetical protein